MLIIFCNFVHKKYKIMGNYTIKSGDTGYGIAKALGIDFNKLAAANPQVKN